MTEKAETSLKSTVRRKYWEKALVCKKAALIMQPYQVYSAISGLVSNKRWVLICFLSGLLLAAAPVFQVLP